jgi:peptidyl-prolyl cis-trans isomerase C
MKSCPSRRRGLSSTRRKKSPPPVRSRGFAPPYNETSNEIVARVGDSEITGLELARAVHSYSQNLFMRGQKPPPNFEDTVLDVLIESELLYQAGLKLPIPDLGEKVERMYRQALSRFPSEAALAESLAREAMTPERLRQRFEKEIIVNYAIEKKVYDEITVDDEEISAFYDKNREELKEKEKIRARQILILMTRDAAPGQKAAARAKIRQLKQRIEAGEDFGEIAREYSEDPSREEGGDLGFLSRGRLAPALEKAAWSLEPGQVSDPVETPLGCHLIRVDEKIPETIPELSAARDKIIAIIKRKKTPGKLKQVIAEIKQEIPVTKFSDD